MSWKNLLLPSLKKVFRDRSRKAEGFVRDWVAEIQLVGVQRYASDTAVVRVI